MIPGWGNHDAADRDGLQLRLRSRGPILVLDAEGLDEQVGAERRRERARRGIAGFCRSEERAEAGGLVGLLNRRGLKVVELCEHELRELRVAARHMNVERGPGLTQKYL